MMRTLLFWMLALGMALTFAPTASAEPAAGTHPCGDLGDIVDVNCNEGGMSCALWTTTGGPPGTGHCWIYQDPPTTHRCGDLGDIADVNCNEGGMNCALWTTTGGPPGTGHCWIYKD